MKKKSILAVALIALVAIVAVLVHRAALARETTAYRFVSVARGNVEATVSATGTLGAVRTVQVGTQVSGQVAELLVDFNDEVKKGQLLARIDPTLQQQAVTDALASVDRARAQELQARRQYNRNAELAKSGLVARSEVESTDSDLDVARANVKSAQVALERARRNLEYTNIYAPIDGVVVERNVDDGQTVAASLSAPQLFLIANDLTHMQILAKVGEGDIGSIKEGQQVKFSVQALPGRTFDGAVEQVRLQSVTAENVVNYTVVVSVENPRKQLLPGMTARVEFLTKAAENVLTVPNAALRFKPESATAEKTTTQTTTQAQAQTQGQTPGQTRRTRTPGAEGSAAGGNRRQGGMGRSGTLYVLDANGKPVAVKVKIGITDGSVTEVSADTLKEGTKVIAGTITASQAAETTSANPFQSSTGQSQQRGGQRPGGF
jgi:HlyD family secretion protein